MGENGIESKSSEASAPTPSPFEAPQISLPKGGGAIRGIDEKSTANPEIRRSSCLGGRVSEYLRVSGLAFPKGRKRDEILFRTRKVET